MRKIIAFDQGPATGWAIRTRPDRVMFGSEDFTSYTGVDGRVHYYYESWLRDFLDSIRPHVVISEQPIVRGHNTLYMHGFTTILQMLCFEMKIATEMVNLSTAKKSLTNHGNATKEAMIAACHSLGYAVTTDHEADAVAILRYRELTVHEELGYVGKVVNIKPRALNTLARKNRRRRL